MTNLLNHNLYCFNEYLNRAYEVSAIDYPTKTVTVIGTEIKQDDQVVDRILRSFDFHEVRLLCPTGREDETGRPIVEGDIVVYGEKFEFNGVIIWNDRKLTWEIENTDNDKVDKYMFLSDTQPEFIHIVSSKYGREV